MLSEAAEVKKSGSTEFGFGASRKMGTAVYFAKQNYSDPVFSRRSRSLGFAGGSPAATYLLLRPLRLTFAALTLAYAASCPEGPLVFCQRQRLKRIKIHVARVIKANTRNVIRISIY